MVEGGSEVLGSFLAARLVDEVALFRAPLLLGGRGSLGAFGGPDPRTIGTALRLEPVPETAGLRLALARPAALRALAAQEVVAAPRYHGCCDRMSLPMMRRRADEDPS